MTWNPDAGTGGSEDLTPVAPTSTPPHSVTFDTSTWPSTAEQLLLLLFWRRSYIFNDLQNLPLRREGRVEITAKQFALRIKWPSLPPSKNMQKEINVS